MSWDLAIHLVYWDVTKKSWAHGIMRSKPFFFKHIYLLTPTESLRTIYGLLELVRVRQVLEIFISWLISVLTDLGFTDMFFSSTQFGKWNLERKTFRFHPVPGAWTHCTDHEEVSFSDSFEEGEMFYFQSALSLANKLSWM